MPLEHLLAELEREAEAAAERTLAEARTEAERIAAAAAERLAHRRAEYVAARRTELSADLGGALAAARREARRAALAARERLLERVFTEAARRLPEVAASETYAAALPGDVAAALAFLGDQPAVLRCTPALAERVRQAAGPAAATVVPDAAVGHGVRAEAADGSLVVDATLEGRLARLRPRLAIAVLARLDVAAPPPLPDTAAAP